MAGLIRLQEQIHNRLLRLRSIEAMVRQPQFERLWADSDKKQQEIVESYIDAADRDKVREWMRKHPSLELAERPLKELYKIASRMGIVNYSRKGRLELIRAIQKKEQNGTQQSVHA